MLVRMNVCVCESCGYRWLPRKGTRVLPYRCASCKTTAWNRRARVQSKKGTVIKPTYHGIGRPPRCQNEDCPVEWRHTVNLPDCLEYKKYLEKPVAPPPPPPDPIPVGQPLHVPGVPLGEHHPDCPCIVCRAKRLIK